MTSVNILRHVHLATERMQRSCKPPSGTPSAQGLVRYLVEFGDVCTALGADRMAMTARKDATRVLLQKRDIPLTEPETTIVRRVRRMDRANHAGFLVYYYVLVGMHDGHLVARAANKCGVDTLGIADIRADKEALESLRDISMTWTITKKLECLQYVGDACEAQRDLHALLYM